MQIVGVADGRRAAGSDDAAVIRILNTSLWSFAVVVFFLVYLLYLLLLFIVILFVIFVYFVY